MTEMLFYHLQGQKLEGVLTPLLEKSLERGWTVIVQPRSSDFSSNGVSTPSSFWPCRW